MQYMIGNYHYMPYIKHPLFFKLMNDIYRHTRYESNLLRRHAELRFTLLSAVQHKTASFQKEAMRTHVALYFLWSDICIEKFLCVWVNKTSEHTCWEKLTALQNCDQEKMIGLDCFCL